MVSLFEAFYVFFINFRTLNSKIIPRFIHHVQFFNEVSRVEDEDFTIKVFMLSNCTGTSCCMYFFSPLLLIFFILLINYIIFYCILLLCIYEYHYALYVFHHIFLTSLYEFLTWYKKVSIIFLTQRNRIIENHLLKLK
jgi:hypothetical protein